MELGALGGRRAGGRPPCPVMPAASKERGQNKQGEKDLEFPAWSHSLRPADPSKPTAPSGDADSVPGVGGGLMFPWSPPPWGSCLSWSRGCMTAGPRIAVHSRIVGKLSRARKQDRLLTAGGDKELGQG